MESFFDRSAIDSGLLMLPLFYRLVIDIGLVVLLLLSTAIGSLIVSNFWKGLVGLHSLSFETMKLIGIFGVVMMVVPSFLPVFISSYFYGYIVCNINHKFNCLDVIFVSACCFLGMFTIMDGAGILEDLNTEAEYRELGYTKHTYQLWWERIDKSLTPAAIITLLTMSGLILSCYFNNLN